MRLDYRHELPEASRAMSELERVVGASTLDPKMRELIKLRASQINGCAYCVDMHTKDAEAVCEDPQRPHRLAAWRDDLDGYYRYWAARAGLRRPFGRVDEAAEADRRAIELTDNPSERALLETRREPTGIRATGANNH